MIKQNIKIAIVAILGLITILCVACAFAKIDVCSTSIINFSNETSIIMIQNKEASYIENHSISTIKIEYEKQYFQCGITYESQNEEYTNYFVFLPTVIPKTSSYMITNVIIDSLNVYQYIFKK